MKGFETIEIDRLSKVVEDYEVANEPMENRIEKWIYQFAPKDRSIILYELKHIFEKIYIDKYKFIKYLNTVRIKARETNSFGSLSENKVSFLDIQSKGSSQKDLLKLMENFVMCDLGETLNDYGSAPERYIYVDDCLYTGQKLLSSIESWAEKIESGGELYIMFYAAHTKNKKFIDERLLEILEPKKISFKVRPFNIIYNDTNTLDRSKRFDCLWPSRGIHNEVVKQYINELNAEFERQEKRKSDFFRYSDITEERIFTSKENRKIIEDIFLEKGIYIKSKIGKGNSKFKPLGYDWWSRSLGFGSMLVTYRNIANTCPLVLWWGSDTPSEELGEWYPLFPRKPNQEIDS